MQTGWDLQKANQAFVLAKSQNSIPPEAFRHG
jgi:hypothetical protein